MSEPAGADAPGPKAFGPTALATPANALSMARLVAAPIFAIVLARHGPSSWLLWAVWTVLAASDGLDGHVARWHGTTRSGAFLDPLADKFLVLGALAALADLRVVSVIAVVLIALRELSMSAYRTVVGRRGVSIPARGSAKLKTLAQDLAVGAALLPPLAHHLVVARDVLWVAVALTIISGAQYVADGWRLAEANQSAAARAHERVG